MKDLTWKHVAALGLVLGTLIGLVLLGHPDIATSLLAGGGGIGAVVLLFLRGLGQSSAETPKAPPTLPPVGPLGIFMILAIALVSCSPASGSGASSPARETARATVLLVTDGVHAADVTCAAVVRAGHPEAGPPCVSAYKVAQPALVAAGESIDAWDDGSQGKVGCAIVQALEALRAMTTAITNAGGKPPAAIADALTFASGLGALACPTKGAT